MSTVVLHSFPVWLPQTQTWLYNQVRHLPGDIEAHIVCEEITNLEQFSLPNLHALSEGPRWHYFWDKGLRKLRVRPYLGLLTRTARKHRAKVLHSHFGDVGWTDLGAARSARLGHVVTFYGKDVNFLPRQDPHWLERYARLFEEVDRVLCEGPHMAQAVVALGCPVSKVQVHHLGVDLTGLPFSPTCWRPGNPLRVLIAASFREKKGIPYAIEALGRLQEEVVLELTIIGDADGEARSQREKVKIMDALQRYDLSSKTRFLGFRPHELMLAEAAKHHVFLSPSVTAEDGDTEGGAPVSLIEMAACGLMIVSTDHCDIPEVVQDGITGLLAGERDAEGLLAHLRWLLAHPGQWQAMLEAGRRHIEAEYDAAVQGEKLAAIYRSLT